LALYRALTDAEFRDLLAAKDRLKVASRFTGQLALALPIESTVW